MFTFMKKGFLIFLFLISFMLNSKLYAAYHEVLPKGVRLFGMKQVVTNTIDGFYGSASQSQYYDLNLNIDAKLLSEIEELDEYMLRNIKKDNPEVFDKLSAGKWSLEVDAKAKVNGFGFAYGLTNTLMFTATIPYFHIKVNMNATRTSSNNYKQMNSTLNASESPAGVHFNLTNLPDPNGDFLQNILVNGYGYAPIGNWEGKGFGDLTLELKKRLSDHSLGGDAVTIGISLPTGQTEKPEILQDVSFGNGYWSLFLEYGGSFRINSWIGLESSLRGSLSTPVVVRKRLSQDYDFRLSSEEDDFLYKPGEKLDYSLLVALKLNDWLTVSPQYIFIKVFDATYESYHPISNNVFEKNSGSELHKARIALELSSITPFMKKIFPIPFTFILSGEKIIRASNTPDIEMIGLESRIIF